MPHPAESYTPRFRRMTRTEWRRVVIFAVAVMLITSIPYIIGAANSNDAWRFGGMIFGVEDGHSYLAKMRLGARGAWQFSFVYTSETHQPAFLFLPYLMLGKVAALFAPPDTPVHTEWLILIFHVARIGFGVGAILATYRFMACFLPRGGMRWLAILLVSVGGGLGWAVISFFGENWLGSSPVDFYLPEAYTFYLLLGLPHLSLARAALLGGYLLFFRPGMRNWIGAGVCWLIMGICVPFYVAVLYAILGVWGLLVWLRLKRFPLELLKRGVIATLIPLPVLLYNTWLFASDPVYGAWSNQNILPSPHPLHYVAGLGVVAGLGLWAIQWAWRRGLRHPAHLLLIGWAGAAPLLAYLPFTVQRRLLEGVFIPLCILAVIGLRYGIVRGLAKRSRRRRGAIRRVWRRGAWLTAGLLLPTTALILLSTSIRATQRSEPVFHSQATIALVDWLNQQAPRGSVVIAPYSLGNYLPVRSDVRAFFGHGPETINGDRKRADFERFLVNGDLQVLTQWQGSPIQYIVLNEAMSGLGAPLYRNEEWIVYSATNR